MLDRLDADRLATVQSKIIALRVMLPLRALSHKSTAFTDAHANAMKLVWILRLASGRSFGRFWSELSLYDLILRWRKSGYELTSLHEQGLALRKKAKRSARFKVAEGILRKLAEENPLLTISELQDRTNTELKKHFAHAHSEGDHGIKKEKD